MRLSSLAVGRDRFSKKNLGGLLFLPLVSAFLIILRQICRGGLRGFHWTTSSYVPHREPRPLGRGSWLGWGPANGDAEESPQRVGFRCRGLVRWRCGLTEDCVGMQPAGMRRRHCCGQGYFSHFNFFLTFAAEKCYYNSHGV